MTDNSFRALAAVLRSRGLHNSWFDIQRAADIIETNSFTDEVRERLRALRLWHWKQVLPNRKLQQAEERNAECANRRSVLERHASNARHFDDIANFHIKAVQTLNDFFPLGDTAEMDASK